MGETAKRVGLLAKRRKLIELHKLEEEQMKVKEKERSLQRRMQLLQIDSDIAQATAREEVYREGEDSIKDSASNESRSTKLEPNKKVKEWLMDVPRSAPDVDVQPHGDVGLMNTLISYNLKSLMPKVEIVKFGGDFTEYKSFIRSFDSLISSKLSDNSEKLYYLEQFTFAKPRDIVKACLHMDSAEGYCEARRLLEQRFGDPNKIASAYVEKVLGWRDIKPDDVGALDEYSITLRTCSNALSNVSYLSNEMEHPRTLLKILEKLPYYIQEKWRRKVDEIYEARSRSVTFEDLVLLVESEARIASNPLFGKHLFMNSKGRHQERNFQHKEDKINVNFVSTIRCWKCNEPHLLDDCPSFGRLSHEEKEIFVKKNSLCFNCLRKGHLAKLCRSKKVCGKCYGHHHTSFHVDHEHQESPPVDLVERSVQAFSILSGRSISRAGKMMIVPVKISSSSGVKVDTYALLDSGSSSSFCTDGLLCKLQAKNVETTRLSVSTISESDKSFKSSITCGLTVSDLYEQNFIPLPPVYSVRRIPVDKCDIITTQDLETWPHLCDIDIPQIKSEVELLLGMDVPSATEPWEVKHSESDGGPYAVRTRLGWVVCGALKDLGYKVNVNRIKINNIGIHEVINSQIADICDLGSSKFGHSAEDLWWINEMDSKAVELPCGKQELPLPIRNREASLPSTRFPALRRLEGLKRKMLHPDYHRAYTAFMSEMIEDGYAELVPESEISKTKVWYIPHFGVYHPRKPDKIRVVYDCAAKVGGVSLNDLLVQGPDLTNSLIEVLMKFRQGAYAYSADINRMFYQVAVPVSDRDYMRFFWWKDGDYNKSPSEYRMTVHLFGACSSPACANYALRKTALLHQREFFPGIASTILNSFYVDDCLKALDDKEDLVHNAIGVRDLCLKGGFELAKFTSNDMSVLVALREAFTIEVDFDECLRTRAALGVLWGTNDTLCINLMTKSTIISKRTLMSCVASFYDPLGIAAPIILQGRLLLQESCRLNLDWDEPLSGGLKCGVDRWVSELNNFSSISINRNFKPFPWHKVVRCELHCFSDASMVAYGAVSYLRFIAESGVSSVSFLYGKSHVAPLKSISVPRLELIAATLAIRVSSLVCDALDIKIDETIFWTDSITVLRYIRNRKSRYQIFVANRLALIWSGSEVGQWKFVNGALNPADEASRGIQSERWLMGPQFLRCSRESWPAEPVIDENPGDDENVKQYANTVLTSINVTHLFLEYHSNWVKMRVAVAWILKYKTYLLCKVKGINPQIKPLNTADFVDAEMAVISCIQYESFRSEFNALKEKRTICASSNILRLNPFLGEKHVIRVGGRLSNANLTYEEKYPILLPGTAHVTRLIIKHYHELVGHSGIAHVLARIRTKYWIIRGHASVKFVLRKCIVCRKFQAPLGHQIMADLPASRISEGAPPFTHSGVDCFGPFYVKCRRSQVKRYGVVFTCLTIRAVHIEVAYDLSTDSFINCLRRFLARRGEVKTITCDNGTNFVGAVNEIERVLLDWNAKVTKDFLMVRNIDWHFNPPLASHFGGAWERQIRTIRKVFLSVLNQQTLTDDTLSTLFCEVEAIVNSRPLAVLTTDVDDLVPLTPSQLLTLKSNAPMFCINDSSVGYCRRKWKHVQYLASLFWARWRCEYMKSLQVRQKWTKAVRDMQVGDVVLVVDEKLPRGHWPLGRVIRVKTDLDGHVRRVEVKSRNGVFERPVSKLVLILENDELL